MATTNRQPFPSHIHHQRVLVLANSLANQVNGNQQIVSGAINAWVRDAMNATQSFTILSPDEETFAVGKAMVVPISKGVHCMDPLLARRFNGSGGWQIMHSDAYVHHYPRSVLEAILAAADVPLLDDVFDSFVRFVEKTQPNEGIEDRFMERFRVPLDSLQPGCTVFFEGSKVIGLPLRYAARLRSRGIQTVVRWHEAIPPAEALTRFSWGTKMLRSFAAVDRVFVHTKEYQRRLHKAFSLVKLQHTPRISTFRLGIDEGKFRRELGSLTAFNVRSELSNFSALTTRQQALLVESLITRQTIPHRWVVADTLDPIKGSIQVYEAVRRFLVLERSRHGEQALRNLHRVFIVQSPRFLSDSNDPSNMNVAYQGAALKMRQELEAEFPGIVLSCECFREPHYRALTAVYEYSSVLSGGTNDGLNLVVPECLFVNYLLPTSVNHGIIGSGAGFAMECVDRGHKAQGFFPAAGDIGAFVENMKMIVDLRERQPSALRRKLEMLVEREVLDRKDTLLNLPD